MFISQITDDNIDLLSKMVPDRILHHKFPIFFFVINICVEVFKEYVNILFPTSVSSAVLITHWCSLVK